MQILSNSLFVLQYDQNIEKRLLVYVDEKNPAYEAARHMENTEQPYGTLLLDLSEADTGIFEQMALAGANVVGRINITLEDNKIEALACKVKPLLESLPDLFLLFRERGLRIVDAVIQGNVKQRKEVYPILLEQFDNLFIQAHDITNYIEQLKTVLRAGLFSAVVYGQAATPEIRMDMLYKVLGINDERFNQGVHGDSHTNLLHLPDGASFLRDGRVEQRLISSAEQDLHSYELYYDMDMSLQSTILAYVLDIISKHVVIEKCAHCGRYFVAIGKSIYCERTVDASGRTCRQVGATATYAKKLQQAPAKKHYRQAYKNNFARMAKGALSKEEFEQWKIDAKKHKDRTEKGEMKLDDFLSWLKYGE